MAANTATTGPAGPQEPGDPGGAKASSPDVAGRRRWAPWVHRNGDRRPPPDREDDIPVALYGLRRGTVTLLTLLCAAFALFTLIPIAWIMINSTKTQANIFESFGFWFQRPFVLWHNFVLLFQNVDGYGIYFQWFGNTALYALLGGGGATVLAGYGFARFSFRGSR